MKHWIAAKAQIIPVEPPTNIPSNPNAVFIVLNSLIDWLFYILLIAAIFVIIWSAFLFLTAGNNPENASKARGLIIFAIVAVVIAFLSKAIIFLIARSIGVPNVGF